MANQVSIPLYQKLLDGFDGKFAIEQKAEPDALRQARQKALENFRKSGFPTTRVEDWKYTNVIPFLKEDYALQDKAKAGAALAHAVEAATIEDLDSYRIVLLNGQLQETATDEKLPDSISIRPMAEAKQEATFLNYFGKGTDVEKHHFAALNTAMFTDGLLIEVKANASIDKPLHIIHAFSSENNLFVQPRHLIVLHRSAALSIVESVVTDSSAAKIFVNSLTEVVVEENANLNHYTLQTAKKGLRQLQHTEVNQKRDSVYSNYTFSLPEAELLRNNLHVNLDDEHTESHLYGLYLGADQQLLDNHTFMNHQKAHCESNEVYKGVLLDKAVGVFNGKVFVQVDAQKTNAFQQNNNLLLSPTATINSKPQLEIFADDVKCSHGSTIGQLSQEAMFYLQSRGIGEDSARAMLVSAFAFDVTEKIKIPELEAHINNLITHHIPANQELIKA
ncbi:iron-regulated ABC transporter permease protein SufD [Pontibacter ummariensis]|uniref:Iron-regulated ABC transporter permease protein SufD n=1 Tax=Pontibacter ummariensis TaxID=1610492 RepID=A0A239D617_9BACT|nr:Fe-S cluster assembly protein SufD [Pontibacter ummariensis]PRY14233.1 iron-regulated ABC transporter permease protein SufD [Pontibacter ummariensis]SNS27023.1 Iron-regulated ABC transporter permease protein SufD [Pontibacter ummariensis]